MKQRSTRVGHFFETISNRQLLCHILYVSSVNFFLQSWGKNFADQVLDLHLDYILIKYEVQYSQLIDLYT